MSELTLPLTPGERDACAAGLEQGRSEKEGAALVCLVFGVIIGGCLLLLGLTALGWHQ